LSLDLALSNRESAAQALLKHHLRTAKR